MQPGALRPYERSLTTQEPLALNHCGRTTPLDLDRWLAPADEVDQAVLDRVSGPALDVGCGPGRIVTELSRRGILALGIDIAPTAVAMTRAGGAHAVRRSVFGRVPGQGRWRALLLLDGNIGIGGDARRLLTRSRELLCADGKIFIETHPDSSIDEQVSARFVHGGAAVGPSFAWAHVGRNAVQRYAALTGLAVAETWCHGGREFTELVSAPVTRL